MRSLPGKSNVGVELGLPPFAGFPAIYLARGFSKNASMLPEHKYARIERERRFLLDEFPTDPIAVRIRRITDYYIDGTQLRLREMNNDGGPTVFKLTQKVPERGNGAQQGFITTIHLTEKEFCVLARLPAKKLNKIRYSVPPFGIDVFQGNLEGLLLAEAEFDSDVAAESLTLPSFVVHEVSADERFTGGRLVRASRPEVQDWLLEYGIRLK
jgi:CYTH domain-containing protein